MQGGHTSIRDLMSFHELQVSTFILLTSLGFVCALWGTMLTGRLSCLVYICPLRGRVTLEAQFQK